jgi:AraC-like DNA-binding protein
VQTLTGRQKMTTEHNPKIYLYRRIVQAKLFIDRHFANNINLNDIAGEAFFSKFHFTRLFKTIYGKTPHQYLTVVRIEKAKELLQTEISVTEVCFSVGFESVSSFKGLFKRYTTLTPSLYQQQKLKRKQEILLTPLKFIPYCFAKKRGWIKK